MARVIKSFFRNVVEMIASESNEMLSARRRSHLLQYQMYSRLERSDSE